VRQRRQRRRLRRHRRRRRNENLAPKVLTQNNLAQKLTQKFGAK
jgi:hypothetical protein